MMGAPKLSPQQAAVVHAAVTGGSFRSSPGGERQRCIALNSKGLLQRDGKDADLWYPTETAQEWAGSTVRAGVPAVAEPVSAIPAMERQLDAAQSLFAEGDVMAARRLAEMVYAQAKSGGQFSAKAHLRESLEACHRIQAGALRIEIKAKMLLAEEWERAGAEGKTLKGRPKSVPDENAFTAAEAGLTRKELHEAKKLLDAERKQPGIAERAIAARLAQGLEPTRASLNHAIGTRTATKQERGDNLYETPPEGTWTIVSLEDFSPTIDEPFCGRGAIARVLEDSGYEVTLADIVDYGTATRDGVCQEVVDFRNTADVTGNDIVSNPPYGDGMNACIAHALRVRRPRKMALLLNLNVLAGFEDPDRTYFMEECPPARIYINKHRLPMMHRDGWDGNKASSQMNTMWCVWEMQDDGTYGTTTIMKRVDFADFVPAAAPESEAA